MIRQRMRKVIEGSLCNTQYGFRPQRSTSHALYIVQRIQDYAKIKGQNLLRRCLSGKKEKAFDKIQHGKLILALKRMGFSKHYCDVFQNCYSNLTFSVKDAFGVSNNKRQHAEIRQGCPISPYLFILVMSCIDHDIKASASTRVQNARAPGLLFDMVYCADDASY